MAVKPQKLILVVGVVLVVTGLTSVFLLNKKPAVPGDVNTPSVTAPKPSQSTGTTATSVAPTKPVADQVATPPSEPPQPNTVGVPPTLAANANPHVASVVEAVRTGKHPERLSPLIAPAEFDANKFSANPRAYLDVVEPGRVFQTAAPGPQVPVLQSVGLASRMIMVGESCTLSVQTAPAAPVSFMTMDLGTFPNSLTAITIQADDQGVATTTYKASGGVIAEVNILAGSPLASGQVQFHVIVTETKVSTR